MADARGPAGPTGVHVEQVARAVARPGSAHDALTGTWLGHALHPLMADARKAGTRDPRFAAPGGEA